MILACETTTIESWLRVFWCFNQFRGSAVYEKQDWMAGTVKCGPRWTNQKMTKKRAKPRQLHVSFICWTFGCLRSAPSLFRGQASIVNTSIVHILFYTYAIHYSIQHASSLTISGLRVHWVFFCCCCTSPTCVCICVCWRVSWSRLHLQTTVLTCCWRPLQWWRESGLFGGEVHCSGG